MTSAAQVSANRVNAQKSTGPRSPEGKAAVAQNAVRHGLLARAAVLQGEDPEEFAEYREEVLEDLHADGTLEVVLAERIVSLSWRLQRAARNQNAAFEVLYDQHTGDPQALLPAPEPAPGLDPGVPARDDATIGRILVQDFAQEKILERLLMYERRIEGSLYRTMAQLEKRQRLRGAGPATEGGLIRSMGAGSQTRDSAFGVPFPPMTVQDAHATHGRACPEPAEENAHAPEPQGGTPNGSGDRSCQTNPISGDPDAVQPTAGGVPPSCGAAAETDSAKQSQFAANCLPDHGLRAWGTLGTAIS